MAEEGRAIGQQESQDSGDETLVDPQDIDLNWTGGILSTDGYAVGRRELEKEKQIGENRDREMIYQG